MNPDTIAPFAAPIPVELLPDLPLLRLLVGSCSGLKYSQKAEVTVPECVDFAEVFRSTWSMLPFPVKADPEWGWRMLAARNGTHPLAPGVILASEPWGRRFGLAMPDGSWMVFYPATRARPKWVQQTVIAHELAHTWLALLGIDQDGSEKNETQVEGIIWDWGLSVAAARLWL